MRIVKQNRALAVLAALLLMLLVLPATRAEDEPEADAEADDKPTAGQHEEADGHHALPGEDNIMTPPPPFSEDIFPCSMCHEDLEPNPEKRELMMHEDIQLNHGPKRRWCFDCHNPDDRDKLRLVDGTLISFEKSYVLCGQCHGPKLRDWRAGVHGKRTGYWNGKKQYLLCPHCHNPHSPKFRKLTPKPPPHRPGQIR